MIATSDFRPLEPIAGEPDIDESYIRQCDPVVLQTLLIDRTETHLNKGIPVNIKWATEDYARQYDGRTGYGSEDQIMPDAISTDRTVDLKVVTPRVKKRLDEQRRRSVEKAEVFTPSWVCNEQNNLVSEVENFHGYLKTRFVRFIILQGLTSINLPREAYTFVPVQDFSEPRDDAKLYKKYKLTREEIAFIESMIKPME